MHQIYKNDYHVDKIFDYRNNSERSHKYYEKNIKNYHYYTLFIITHHFSRLYNNYYNFKTLLFLKEQNLFECYFIFITIIDYVYI